MAKIDPKLLTLDEPVPSFDGFSKEMFQFLHGVKKNNNKAWFEAHREDYELYLREPIESTCKYAMGVYFPRS